MTSTEESLYILLDFGILGKQPVHVVYDAHEINPDENNLITKTAFALNIKNVFLIFDGGDVSRDVSVLAKLPIESLINIKNIIKDFVAN
jgi:hypothetical protein